MRFFRRYRIAALSCAIIVAALAEAGAAGPGVTVTSVSLTGGKLVISGTTTLPGTVVTIQGTTFTATSNLQKQFAFSVSYRTPDCKLTLATSTGTLPVLIGNCGPTGVNPKGNWNLAVAYAADDLALYVGQTYRALRANKNKRPDVSAADWQLFAAKGVPGPSGAPGAKGDKGDPGDGGAFGGSIKREVVCRAPGDYEIVHGPIAVTYTCRAVCLTNEIGLLGATWRTDKTISVASAKTNAEVVHVRLGDVEVSQISSILDSPVDILSFSFDQHLAIFCMPL